MAERKTRIRGSQIQADTVQPSDLQSTNAAADTLIPAYDVSTGKFTWVANASGGLTLDGAYDFGGAGAGRAINVDSGAVRFINTETTNNTFEVTDAASLTTGRLAYLYSNSADASARSLVAMHNDNVLATNTQILYIRNDAAYAPTTSGGLIHAHNLSAGNGVWIEQSGNMVTSTSAFKVNITGSQNQGATALVHINNAANGNTPTMRIDNGCSSYGLQIEQNAVNYAANTLLVHSNSSTIQANSALVKFYQQSVGATEPALEIVNAGTGAGIEITSSSTGNLFTLSQTGNGYGLYFTRTSTLSAIAISQDLALAGSNHIASFASSVAQTNDDSALVLIQATNASNIEPCLQIHNNGTGTAIEISGNNGVALHAVDGDIRNVAWVDYGGSSTIVGWSSFTTKQIYYKKVGNLVFVSYDINGTSNNTVATFTLPYTSSNTIATFSSGRVYDNGVQLDVAGLIHLAVNSVTVNLYSNMGTGAWTGSGVKNITGTFWYEANT